MTRRDTMIPVRAIAALASVLLVVTRGVSLRTVASAAITLTLQSPTIVGGNGTTASIVLATPAPAGGVVVTMTNPPGTIVQAGASQVGTIQAIGSTKIAVAAGQRQVVVN